MMSNPRDTTPLLHRPYMAPYKRTPWYRNQMFYLNLIRRSLAEFLGTSLFVFTAISALSNVNPDPEYSIRSSSATTAGLAQGLAYGGLVAAMMHVSGGHLNPAVTLGVLVAGGLNVLAALVYFIAQMIGGIVGAACVLAYDSTSSDYHNHSSTVDYGLTLLESTISPSKGILIELLLTMLLVTIFVHTTMERSEFRPAAPVVIGLALTAAVLSSYSLTSGSMNPARSFGPAVVSSHPHRWTNHYVYWVGPVLGALLAGIFYRLLLASKPLIPISEHEAVPRTGGHQ